MNIIAFLLGTFVGAGVTILGLALGLVAASEYLEEQLQNLSDDYWGHMTICNNENDENNENNDKI